MKDVFVPHKRVICSLKKYARGPFGGASKKSLMNEKHEKKKPNQMQDRPVFAADKEAHTFTSDELSPDTD